MNGGQFRAQAASYRSAAAAPASNTRRKNPHTDGRLRRLRDKVRFAR